jgi:hypothetical protein
MVAAHTLPAPRASTRRARCKSTSEPAGAQARSAAPAAESAARLPSQSATEMRGGEGCGR